MLRTLIIWLALAAPATAEVTTCRGFPMPPLSAQQEPSVPYSLLWLSAVDMLDHCPEGAAACTQMVPFEDRAEIYIVDTLSEVDRACVPIYEKAHLPPNNWIDAEVEARFR